MAMAMAAAAAAATRRLRPGSTSLAPPTAQVRMVFGLLQQRPVCASTTSNKYGLVDSGSLKQLERRILELEVRSSFYKNFKWVLVGPFVGTLMATLSAINIHHDVSTAKEQQKNTAEKLSNLKRQIEYLEGRIN